jgi:cell division protein FtsL
MKNQCVLVLKHKYIYNKACNYFIQAEINHIKANISFHKEIDGITSKLENLSAFFPFYLCLHIPDLVTETL